MSHDVFLCYDERDEDSASEMCRLLEQNGMGCWLKSRDYLPDEPVSKIVGAIMDSEVFVLIYSKNSISKSVIREVNKVFGKNIKIMIFNLDDSSISGKLEFYLNKQYELSLYPNAKGKLKRFVQDVSEAVSRPCDKVMIPSETLKHFRKSEPFMDKVVRYSKVAVPALIVLVLIVWFFVLPSGHHTTDDGVFSMNITGVDVKNMNGKYVYTVLGDAYNMPDDSDRYIMQLDFFDKDKKQIYEVNATCDEFRAGVMATFNMDDDNITDVGFTLVDFSDNVICMQNYTLNP